MLVVAAEVLSENNRENFSFKGKYEVPELKDFVEASLRSVWFILDHQKLRHKENFRMALNEIKIAPIEGVQNRHSEIEDSVTVEISLPTDMEDMKQKIVLATSTRFKEENLIAFAKQMGFNHKSSIKSPLNNDFKQFVFFYDSPASG